MHGELVFGVELMRERRATMSRQHRPRRHRGDPVRDLQEWQNHQYDPGYVGNLGRLRLFSGGRRSSARYLLTSLAAIVAATLVLFGLVSAGLALNIAALVVGIALLAVLIVRLKRNSKRRTHRGR
jgi:Flp pilus assembly protein TadB